MNTKPNFESRIANRARSVFAAFGQIVSDFYLEAGIYFVGGFNAALVAWGIYTDLTAADQPPAYAITLALVAFVAVEGLAVYLVGAAAKTKNGALWFFSVVFAGFFTYAHYREMTSPGVISQYITLAIPFFVVVGYWARTIKVEIDTDRAETKELERVKLEYQLEQARLEADHKRAMANELARLKHAEKLATIEAKSVKQSVSQSVSQVSRDKSLETLKGPILDALTGDKPNMTQLATQLGVSRGTLYRHLGTLAEQGILHKNGNGYEVNNNQLS